MPGQNSAKVIFMTREALFLNPRRWSAAVVVAGSTAVLVGMTISTDVGRWVHTLPSHPKLDEMTIKLFAYIGMLTKNKNILYCCHDVHRCKPSNGC